MLPLSVLFVFGGIAVVFVVSESRWDPGSENLRPEPSLGRLHLAHSRGATESIESMLTVLQHPEVWAADFWEDGQTEQRRRPDHPKLDRTANLIVTAWSLGVPAENAAQYALFARGDRVLITMEAGNNSDFESLITWLEAEEVYILDRAKEPTRDGDGKVVSYSTVALTPVSVIAAAAQRGDVVWISAEDYTGQEVEMQRHHWPLEALWYEDTIVDEFVPEDQKVRRPDLE